MNKLADIIAKISDTQAAMRDMEIELAANPTDFPLQIAYESLQKRHDRLEEKFLACANDNSLEVCSYRIFSEFNDTYSISAFGSILRDFQKWFSAVYGGLKVGPRERARLSPEISTESSLNFAFTYPGSIGIAMTIPSERLLFENDLQRAMLKSTEMLKAESSEGFHALAEEVGPAAVRTLYTWAGDHVDANMGAEIRWVTGDTAIAEVVLGIEKIKNLKQAIEETSDIKEEKLEISGSLVGADTNNHTFHMICKDSVEIRGKMSDTIGESYTVELPQEYIAEILKTSSINYATDTETVKYYLEALKPV